MDRFTKIVDFLDLFDETWRTDTLHFELKGNYKPTYSRPYPVLKVHEEVFKK